MAADQNHAQPLTLAETCSRLRITRGVATRLIRSGSLRAVKIGRCWRVPAEAVEALLVPVPHAA